MIGKNFSCNNTGKRHKSDFYQTPYSITEQLLENESFDYNKKVLECASGKGAIHKILLNNFKCENIAYYEPDLNNYDFLNPFLDDKFDYIITNPPYSKSSYFIEKAKLIALDKFAMLLPLSYLHGQKRYESNIFRDVNYPLTKVYVFTRYPMLTENIREDGKYNTGMMVYAWFIWEKSPKFKSKCLNKALSYRIEGLPIIKWIDNNKYVLNKSDKN